MCDLGSACCISQFFPNQEKFFLKSRCGLSVRAADPPVFNLLTLSIGMHFLPTVLHIFLIVLLGEFAYKSRHLIFDDHFLYSHDLYD